MTMKCRYDFHMECAHWARAARVAWMNFFALLLSGMNLCMKARVEIVNMPISMAVARALCSVVGTGVVSGSVFDRLVVLPAFSVRRFDRRSGLLLVSFSLGLSSCLWS